MTIAQKRVRRRRKQVTRKKKVMTNKTLTRKVHALEKKPEMKYSDASYNADPGAGTTIAFFPFAASQGDNFDERAGEEIRAIKTVFNFRTRANAGMTGPLLTRVVAFYDMACGQTGPVLSVVPYGSSVGSTGQGLIDNGDSGGSDIFMAPLNYRSKDRYHVVMDKLIVNNMNTTNFQCVRHLQRTFHHHNFRIKYVDSGGTVASIATRHFCIVVINSNSANSNNVWTVHCRGYYSDS